MRIISEAEFAAAITAAVSLYPEARSVVGPERSGQVAAVYASHHLGVPWLPPSIPTIPEPLRPVLVVDTATWSGRSVRRLARRFRTDLVAVAFAEPPRVRFWYEARSEGEMSGDKCCDDATYIVDQTDCCSAAPGEEE